jgi:hypothetical protein
VNLKSLLAVFVESVTKLFLLDLGDMDRDSRDDFTFAKLSDLKLPVTFRM